MEKIISIIFSSPISIVFIASLISMIYVFIFYNSVIRGRPEREHRFEEARKRFIDDFENRLDLKGVSSIAEVQAIRRVVLSDTNSQRFASTPTDELLQYHLSTIAGEARESDDNQQYRDRYTIIMGLLSASGSDERFLFLPPRDAATAMQLIDSISNDDSESSKRYLLVLSESLGSQLRQATRQAKFRLSMSIVGAVASLGGVIVATVSVVISS